MSRRLEIELTSQRDDGTWTWRAARARRPKGEVGADLVPDTAAVGTVLKAEAVGGLDGLEITAVLNPRARAESGDRLELIGGGGGPLVTTRLASKSRRYDHDERGGRADERPRGRKRRDGRDGDGRRDGKRNRRDEPGEDRRDGRRDRKPRRDDGTKGRSRRGDGDDPRGSGSRSGTDRRTQRREPRSGDKRSQKSPRSSDTKRSARPPRPRTPGIKAKRVHRQAVLEALPEDQRPLAREVLRGGVPGARKSIERTNAKAVAQSLPQIKSEPILALAEQLAPVLKAAEWHDRADAALAGIAKIDLRDIRSVIAAADSAARTDETRALAESLRSGLAQRLEVDHREWLDELANTISEGRTVRALRLSSHPPKAGAPLPPDMAERLANMASADLNPTASQQRWSTVVDSVVLSPVRTLVIPVGAPDKPTEELLSLIHRLADRVPQIASLFGVEPQARSRGPRRPPPPPPAAPEQHSETTPAAPEQHSETTPAAPEQHSETTPADDKEADREDAS